MALQAFRVTRAQDSLVQNLMEITPKDWRRFPPRVGGMDPANIANAQRPRYAGAGVDSDWAGGEFGDDVDQASASVSIAKQPQPGDWPDYIPRTQAEKATLSNLTPGTTLAVDVARARGWIAPYEPYRPAPEDGVDNPEITLLDPATAVAGGQDIFVSVQGTGFTPWTQLFVGGGDIPYTYQRFISDTEIQIIMDVRRSQPGTITIVAKDAGLESAPADFTFTAPAEEEE